jgi:hypothetical protein
MEQSSGSRIMRIVVATCLISTFATLAPNIVRADEKPKESVTFQYSKPELTYKQQSPDGGGSPPPPKPSIKGPSIHPIINVHPTISTVRVR